MTSRERGGILFSEGGGGDIVFGPKYKPLKIPYGDVRVHGQLHGGVCQTFDPFLSRLIRHPSCESHIWKLGRQITVTHVLSTAPVTQLSNNIPAVTQHTKIHKIVNLELGIFI